MKKKLLKNSLAYLILDREVLNYSSLLAACQKAIKAGVDIIQLRDKAGCSKDILSFAQILRQKTKRNKTIFILNDRLDIALISDADGLHLGQDDIPVKQARKFLGNNKLIGKSCHNLKQALAAQKEGADYIGLGPIFPTFTKPSHKPIGLKIIQKVEAKLKIPVFAIGGINLSNADKVLEAGAQNLAVCRAILSSGDAFKATDKLKKILNKNLK